MSATYPIILVGILMEYLLRDGKGSSINVYFVDPFLAMLVEQNPPWDKETDQSTKKMGNSFTSEVTNQFAFYLSDTIAKFFLLEAVQHYYEKSDYQQISLEDFYAVGGRSLEETRTPSSFGRRSNKTSGASCSTITNEEIIFPRQDDFKALHTDGKSIKQENGAQKYEQASFSNRLKEIPSALHKKGSAYFENPAYRKYLSLTDSQRQIILLLIKEQPCLQDRLREVVNLHLKFNNRRNFNIHMKVLHEADSITTDETGNIKIIESLESIDLMNSTYPSASIKSGKSSEQFSEEEIVKIFHPWYNKQSEAMKQFMRLLVESRVILIQYFTELYVTENKMNDRHLHLYKRNDLNSLFGNKQVIFDINSIFADTPGVCKIVCIVNPSFAMRVEDTSPWDKFIPLGIPKIGKSGLLKDANIFQVWCPDDNTTQFLFSDSSENYNSCFPYKAALYRNVDAAEAINLGENSSLFSLARTNNQGTTTSSNTIRNKAIILPLQEDVNLIVPRKKCNDMRLEKITKKLADRQQKVATFPPIKTPGAPFLKNSVYRAYCYLHPFYRLLLIRMSNQAWTPERIISLSDNLRKKSGMLLNTFDQFLNSSLIEIDYDVSNQMRTLKAVVGMNSLNPGIHTYDTGSIKSVHGLSSFTSKDIEKFPKFYHSLGESSKLFIKELIKSIVVSRAYYISRESFDSTAVTKSLSKFFPESDITIDITTRFKTEPYKKFIVYVVNPVFAKLVQKNPPWTQDTSQATVQKGSSVPLKNTNKFTLRYSEDNTVELLFLDSAKYYDKSCAYEEVSDSRFQKLLSFEERRNADPLIGNQDLPCSNTLNTLEPEVCIDQS